MPGRFNPMPQGYAGDLVSFDGFRTKQLQIWSLGAEQINNSSSDELDARYHHPSGFALGRPSIKIAPTTFSAERNTGTIFDIVTGTGTDDWISDRTLQYGLLQDNGGAGAVWDWVETTANTNMPTREVIITRGPVPVGVTPSASTYFAYLHLNYNGMQGDIRIPFVWGRPIGMQWAPDGTSWKNVGDVRQLGNVDEFFSKHRQTGVALHINPMYEQNYISVEVANGLYLVFGVPDEYQVGQGDPTYGSFLPYGGKMRWTGLNGMTTLEVYAQRHQPVSMTVSPRDNGSPHPGYGTAKVVSGGGIKKPTDQSTSFTLNTDGQSLGYTLTASRDDAGDGLGSAEPPRLARATAIAQEEWTFSLGTGFPLGLTPLVMEDVQQVQLLDDQARTFSTSGVVTLNNQSGQYTGLVGRFLMLLYQSIDGGATNYFTFRGAGNIGANGLTYGQTAGRSIAKVTFGDIGCKMLEAIGTEFIADDFCIFTAVRALAVMGGIHPQFLQNIPLYVPPDATADAPYGPAGDDCPYYILRGGNGRTPKYRFTPEMSAWSCLQMLASESALPDPISGRDIPFYCGFSQPDSQLIFQPYDPFALPISAFFSDLSEPGTLPIRKVFELTSDVSQMRTAVTIEGLDWLTNRLNFDRIEQPDSIKAVIGWPSEWIERSARWSTKDIVSRIAEICIVQSGIPDQLIGIESGVTVPWLQAGNVIVANVRGPLNVLGPYVIIAKIDHQSMSEEGTQDCSSTLICRTLFSYV